MSAGDDGVLDLQAACVMLVALAGMVPSYERLDDERVRVAPDVAVLSTDRAARLLASMPKPLICHAESRAGVLEVTCELLAELYGAEQAHFARRYDELGEHGEILSLLAHRYGGDDACVIAALGRGEPTLVSLAGVRRWSHDYEISYASSRIDDANDPRVSHDGGCDEARRRGAKGVLRFTSAASSLATIDGGQLPFPLPKSATAEDRRKAERTFVAMAKQHLFEIDEEDELAAVERDLVERGEIPADSTERYASTGREYMRGVLASQMRQFFEEREMPAECAAFIDACRQM